MEDPAQRNDVDLGLELERYISEPEYNRRKAERDLILMQEFEGLNGKDLDAAVAAWNKAHADDPRMQTSSRSVRRMRTQHQKYGVEGLLAKYGRNRNRSLAIEDLGPLQQHVYANFKTNYLDDRSPSAAACCLAAQGLAIEIAERIAPAMVPDLRARFPHASTFVRAIHAELGESQVYLARAGYQAWNRRYASHIERDDAGVAAGRAWISDHHQLDEMWLARLRDDANVPAELRRALQDDAALFDGTQRRPWLTVWRDYKTGLWLSWECRFSSPNAQRVMTTFAQAVLRYGLPDEIVIDNGKDYRAKDFAGGRLKVEVDERTTKSMLAILGVRARFAWPYHGQSKAIERDFRTFDGWKSRFTPGYTGNSAANKPESAGSAAMRRALLCYDEGVELLDQFVNTILHTAASNGKNMRGRSRLQAWAEEFHGLRTVTQESIALLTMRTTPPRLIGRNGVMINGRNWYAPWMEKYKSTRGGMRIYLRVPDDETAGEAWCFSAETDEYMGRAQSDMFRAPGLAVTEEESTRVSDAIRLMKDTHNAARAAVRRDGVPDVRDVQRHIARALESGAVPAGRTVEVREAEGLDLAAHAVSPEGVILAHAGERVTPAIAEALLAAGITHVQVAPDRRQIQISAADRAIAEDAQIQRTGTYAFPEPPEKPARRKWSTWRSDEVGSGDEI